MTEWGIYGGAGFIGQHLALSVLSRAPDDRVVLLDIKSPLDDQWKVPLEPFLASGRLSYSRVDVREFEQLSANPRPFDVMVNLAAIHREPGHRPEEYFDTNVSGAENICRLADSIGCREIIFTSSISVYGTHDQPVHEQTQAQPGTPYGQSKLAAEKIHQAWARTSGGRLSIIRPGVVFGPGEKGNVTRLLKESLRRRRSIQIVPDQPKAGIYIEELLGVIHWLRQQPLAKGECHLVNGVSKKTLTFNTFGRVLQELEGFKKKPLIVPGRMLSGIVSLMRPLSWVLPAGSKYHPERLAKLTRANDIRATELISKKYPFAWPEAKAIADWLQKGLEHTHGS